MPRAKNYTIRKFEGFKNQDNPEKIDEGASSDGLNWVIEDDRLELRRGYLLLGADDGIGKVTGLRTGIQADGTETLFKTRAKKIEYYDETTEDWIEAGSDILAVSGEDTAIERYSSLAGDMIIFSSPNTSAYQIMTANPGSVIDLAQTDFRGKFVIRNRRSILWDRLSSTGAKDRTGVYGSKLDKDVYSDFTQTTGENVGTGDGNQKTFTHTLLRKAGNSKLTFFGIVITDTVETFLDNFDGTLTGSLGGTGTINYATGQVSVTFNTAPAGAQAITVDYYENDLTSTSIWDFTFSSPPRVAAEGFILRQDDGGGIVRSIEEYNNVYYSLHDKKSWEITISADDSSATNLPYRNKVGIPNWRGAVATGEGIYYVDTSDDNDIRVRLLTLQDISEKVRPESISDDIDLSGFDFSDAVMKEWGDFIVIGCKKLGDVANNRILFYNRRIRQWNPPSDYQAYTLEVYNGALHGGDSTTNNVYELFSGWDDDDSTIPNYLTMNNSRLQLEGLLKKPTRFIMEGEIQPDQTLKVYASIDNNDFIEIAEITGKDDEVDFGNKIDIGSRTIGKDEVGGGGTGETAYHYQIEKKIKIDRFEEIKLKFEATGIGYVSISEYGFKDIRVKSGKSPKKYL